MRHGAALGQAAKTPGRPGIEGLVDGLRAQLKQPLVVGRMIVWVDTWQIGVPIKQLAEALHPAGGLQPVGDGLHGREGTIVHRPVSIREPLMTRDLGVEPLPKV